MSWASFRMGKLRQALVALAQRGALWRDTFNFRFRSGGAQSLPLEEAADAGKQLHLLPQRPTPQGGVGGHSQGNLILSALDELNDGNLLWAIEDVCMYIKHQALSRRSARGSVWRSLAL